MIFGYPASYGHYASEVLPLEYMFGAVSRPIHRVQDLQGIQFLVLFGGEDISTYWYKERPVKAHASATPNRREETEAIIVEECFKNNIPILGICRGAQFMCAFLGGGLWQHVDNHAVGDYGHEMIFEGKIYRTNSYHHQMMKPTGEMEVLAWVGPPLSKTKWGEVAFHEYEEPEPEIVYHRSKKVLMIQGHPEWAAEEDDLYKITHQLVKELLCS